MKRNPCKWIPILLGLTTLFFRLTDALSETYYVDAINGNDTNSGLAAVTPWKSIHKVNTMQFHSGDLILFKRGCVWREQLIPHSGDESGSITYGAYGSGDKPLILGSLEKKTPSDWINAGGNIWTTIPPTVGTETGEELLANPSFDTNTNGWNLWIEGGATAAGSRDINDYLSPPASYRVDCTASGSRSNHIQLSVGNIHIEWGRWYRLTFSAKASMKFTIAEIALMRATSPWTAYATEVVQDDLSITSDWKSFHVLFKAGATDQNAVINFCLGGVLPDGASFHIDSFSFRNFENSEPLMVDVGNLILNGESSCGVKVWEEQDLDDQGDFFYDRDGHVLQMFSIGNPADVYSDIECALNHSTVKLVFKSYVTLEHFDLRYSGCFGVECFAVHHIIITDCDISYIGGSRQDGTSHIVRYGNGIQFWQSARDCIVERNHIWQVYDAAVTNQGSETNTQMNLFYRNNIIRNCEYSFEFWNRDHTSTVKNIFFEHNTCIDAGNVWSHDQRPDGHNGNHLLFYDNTAQTSDFYIRNNIFYQSTEQCMRIANDWTDGLTLDYNCWYQSSGRLIWWLHLRDYSMEDFMTYRAATGLDRHSIVSDPLFIDYDNQNLHLKGNSPCIDAGLDIGIPEDFERTLRPQGAFPDMGAFESLITTDNMILNGDFSDGANHWSLWTDPSALASGSVQNGEYELSITNGGSNTYDIQFGQGSLCIENGKTYDVFFDAYALASRQIEFRTMKASPPWSWYGGQTFTLGAVKKTFTFTFTMVQPTDAEAQLGFNLGGSNHDVYLDNIVLKENTTSVEECMEDRRVPASFELLQNTPNPFNPTTKIIFRLPKPGRLALRIYDTLGRELETLVDVHREAGEHFVVWDAGHLPAGIYLCRLEAGREVYTRKLILQK